MMKPVRRLAVKVGCLGMIGLAAWSLAKERPEATGNMREVFNALMNLQTYLVSESRFSDPKNRAVISKDLKTLNLVSHTFPKKMMDEEPGLAAIAKLYSDYVHDTQSYFKNGNYEFSRNRLRTVTSFCFHCHTRVTSEKSFTDFQNRIEKSQLTAFEKAEIAASTRQFDKALAQYRELLSTAPKNEWGVIEYTRALRHAVSISVRVKRDPKLTQEILDQVTQQKELPEFVQEYVASWKKEVAAWIAEKKQMEERQEEEPKGSKAIAKGRALIEKASSIQSFPADENADISLLRATHYLHEALDDKPKSQDRAEALYLLGMAYQVLQDPMLWELDTIYYESCVREVPHTALSKKCYRRYSDRIYFGYTGSGGTFIPEPELKKLVELRKLSAP